MRGSPTQCGEEHDETPDGGMEAPSGEESSWVVFLCKDDTSMRGTFHTIGSSSTPLLFHVCRLFMLTRDTGGNPMPTLTEDVEDIPRAIPRSAIRHRPLGPHATPAPFVVVQTPRATRGKPHHEPHTTGGPPSGASGSRERTILTLGVGMVLTFVLIFLGQLGLTWVNVNLDDLHYGRPRTFQMDAVVGHGDSAANPIHFVVLNLHGHIQIIELPGGDAAHAKIYVGPTIYGPGADLVPVIVQFPDPRHAHHPEMVVRFQNSQVVFHNTGEGFTPSTP